MSAARPPRISRWLLATTVHADDRRFVLDDLAEGFEDRLRTDGLPVARRWYRQQVRRSIPACLAYRWSRRRGMRLGDRLEDLRFAFRSLARTPVIALVAIVSLGLGLAAATSVFSVANAFLLRPASAAVQDPHRLATVFHSDNDGNPYGAVSYQDYLDLRDQSASFVAMASHRLGIVRLGPVENSKNVMIEIVDGNYFDVLGVDMIRGRRFAPRETERGSAERITVISERLWQDRLGGQEDVIGTDLLLEGKPHRIVGVAPRSLIGRFLALRVDAWVPIGIPGGTFRSTEKELSSRTEQNYGVVARLAEGVDLEAAAAEARIIGGRLLDEYPDIWKDRRGQPRQFTVMGESANRARPDMLAALGTASSVVLLAAGLLLAVACANVASVLLSRADQRRGEIAVRLALGAGRSRLIAMLLTESLLIGLAAGGLAILLTSWAVGSFDEIALPIGDMRLEFDVLVDWRVLAFSAALAVLTSIAFGLAPALQASRPGVADALRGAGSTGGTAVSRLRRALIIGQVAAALIFVVGAAMALDSFRELTAVNWGMDPAGIAVMSANVPEELGEQDFAQHYREVIERLESHPEVAAAHIGSAIEGSAIVIDASTTIRLPGRPTAEGETLRATFNAVTPGYMETLDIQLRAGRSFRASDDDAAPRVVIVNEALARRLWPESSPLGQRLAMDGPEGEFEVAVVGVAADARYQGFEDSTSEFLWVPLLQRPTRMYTLLVKGRGAAEAMVPILRRELDPTTTEIQLITPRTYSTLITYQFAFIRILGEALAIAAAFGLLLAALGIYGVISFAVARRTREMAIRTALGALPAQVVRLVVRDGVRLTAWGMAIGLAVIVPLSAALRAYLGDISTIDITSVLGGAALLGLVATAAATLPARRANRINPVAALRED